MGPSYTDAYRGPKLVEVISITRSSTPLPVYHQLGASSIRPDSGMGLEMNSRGGVERKNRKQERRTAAETVPGETKPLKECLVA
jgi:hypothetical protein